MSHSWYHAQFRAGDTRGHVSRRVDWHEGIVGAVENNHGDSDRLQYLPPVAGRHDCRALPLEASRIVAARDRSLNALNHCSVVRITGTGERLPQCQRSRPHGGQVTGGGRRWHVAP